MTRSALFLPLALLLGFGGIWKLQHGIDAQRASFYQEQDDLVLRSDKAVKLMSLEYGPLLADIYWTRVVQYYGLKHIQHAADQQLLWPLLDLTTTLDPHLLVAYRFGAIFLSDPSRSGAHDPGHAVELLQRGIQENPEYWRFYEDLGFVYYFGYKDYAKASAAFLEGSKQPGAQVWMGVLAAKTAEEGGTLATSAFLWDQLYRSTSDPNIKKTSLMHLQLLQAENDCNRLDTLGVEYEKRHGRRPDTLRDLINDGLLTAVLADPLGFPYTFDTDGKAQLNPASPLFKQQPLYQRPL